jgi:hypothetical protein
VQIIAECGKCLTGQENCSDFTATGQPVIRGNKAGGNMWNSDWLFALSIPDRFDLSQNLFINYTMSGGPECTDDWWSAVQGWYYEVKNFGKNNGCPFQSVRLS